MSYINLIIIIEWSFLGHHQITHGGQLVESNNTQGKAIGPDTNQTHAEVMGRESKSSFGVISQ